MTFLSYVVVVFISFAIRANSQDLKPTNKIEGKVIRMIQNLPEIIEDNKFMTKKGRPFIVYIENSPSNSDRYYHVAVSENNGTILVPHFRFLVKANTYQIYYLDFWNDNFKPIPLKKWRKRKNRTAHAS